MSGKNDNVARHTVERLSNGPGFIIGWEDSRDFGYIVQTKRGQTLQCKIAWCRLGMIKKGQKYTVSLTEDFPFCIIAQIIAKNSWDHTYISH